MKQKLNENITVIYYWYDHLLLRETGEAKIIQQAIEDGDFKTFNKIRKKYGEEFFPREASIFYNYEIIGCIDITTPVGFNFIDVSEYECG